MTALRDQWLAQREQRQQTVLKRQQQVTEILSAYQQQRQVEAAQRLQQRQQQSLNKQIATQQWLTELQQQRQKNRAAVEQQLTNHQQMRSQQNQIWRLELSALIGDLQVEVGTTLSAIAQQRQNRAIALRQKLKQERQIPLQAVRILFDSLAEFRAELAAYRQSLSQQVWGTATTVRSLPAPAANSQPAVPQVTPAVTPQIIEKKVYQYLKTQHQARLGDIEAALKLNRLQTVDALRSLIQKQLIVQRDRIYQLPEEVVL
ncbi:hypothetical protein [Almyronema epifaneia]|uniref:Gas vesicle protein GvpC n=1 Tax=Almyronema epifaneia S1 TaxID=2991925 RepID=A0ABW6IDC2_9CYAN